LGSSSLRLGRLNRALSVGFFDQLEALFGALGIVFLAVAMAFDVDGASRSLGGGFAGFFGAFLLTILIAQINKSD
jgi:hypothetical protein